MVGKLMKHELRALFRVLLYLGVCILALAVVTRLLMFADSDGLFPSILEFFVVYLGFMLCLAGFCLSIAQFSKSLFTGEGYMTFSLPVTPAQLIVSKLLSAIITTVFGIAVTAVTCVILLIGRDLEEWAALFSLAVDLFDVVGMYIASDPLLAVEFAIQLIAAIPMTLLLIYLVISLGQLSTKWRKGITVAIGLGGFFVLSMLETYAVEPILALAAQVSVHLANWIEIVLYLAVDFGSFFLVRHILTHQVNLIV